MFLSNPRLQGLPAVLETAGPREPRPGRERDPQDEGAAGALAGLRGDRYRWVVLAAGTLAQASFSASSVGLPALGPALKSHYGLSLGETGVVLAGIGIGMLFTLLPWGLVADRVDERWVIATGLTGAGAMLAVASTTQTLRRGHGRSRRSSARWARA